MDKIELSVGLKKHFRVFLSIVLVQVISSVSNSRFAFECLHHLRVRLIANANIRCIEDTKSDVYRPVCAVFSPGAVACTILCLHSHELSR